MLVDGKMFASVRATDALWSISDNARGTRTLSVTLDKVVHTWWSTVVQVCTVWLARLTVWSYWQVHARMCMQGDPEIDATKVDSTRQVEDYDEATQASIRKIMVGA